MADVEMGLRSTVVAFVLLGAGCPAPTAAPPAVPPSPEPAAAKPRPTAAPSTTAAGIVLFNPTDREITPYRGYLVSVDGSSGTRQLWPARRECPDDEVKFPALAAHDGRLALDPPIETFGPSGCETTPLPPGEYVVRIESGATSDLRAAGTITIPMTEPVEMAFEYLYDAPWPCDPTRARRAATLAVETAKREKRLPDGFLDGCDLSTAQCVPTPEEAPMPPERCTATLGEMWLRIERPAGQDVPRRLTAIVDRQAVYARMIDVDRTSASMARIDGKKVVVAGHTTQVMHEHGGDAATIAGVRLSVDNPLPRALSYRVERVEFLVDYGCGVPKEVRATAKVTSSEPAKIEPGRSELFISYDAQEAYQGACDRFATRVTLAIEGKTIAVTSEHQVTRIEPMHEF